MSGRAAVATGHPRVTQAAVEVLEGGGNAYDAWIAAIATSCICEPVLASLGGCGFLLAAPADNRPVVVDFFAQTPNRRPPAPEDVDFHSVHAHFGTEIQEFWIGPGTIAVPGVVAGIFEVHERLGRMPLADILSPAIQMAREGTAVTDSQAELFRVVRPAYLATRESRALFGSAVAPGEIIRAGENLRMPGLADVLDCLALEGPDLFYRGEIAAAIVEPGSDGILRRTDLESYAAEIRAPLVSGFGNAQVLINPPPAAGGLLTTFALGILDGAGLGAHRQESDVHARLVAKAIGRTVDIESTDVWDPANGKFDRALFEHWREEIRSLRIASQGTTHASIIDRHGNVVSATVSNGIGSGCVVPGTDIMLNNMLGEAELNPGGLDGWPPGIRLTSMMSPTVVTWPDGSRAAIGSGGSRRIPSAILQVIVNLVAHGMSLDAAIDAPRLHVSGGRLGIEGGFDPDRLGLTLLDWPDHRIWRTRNVYFGGVHAARTTRRGPEAYGDSRRGGAAWTGGAP
ncbi:MAG: gamma-glutamyltransferase [Paracoccaceae bacterium]|nr:gamma-glutamyltransferase [Paracoccaceae bacterium]